MISVSHYPTLRSRNRPVPANRYYRSSSWGDVRLSVNVEVVTQGFERAVDLFANVILGDVGGCQGSNRLLLRSIAIDCSAGYVLSVYVLLPQPSI